MKGFCLYLIKYNFHTLDLAPTATPQVPPPGGLPGRGLKIMIDCAEYASLIANAAMHSDLSVGQSCKGRECKWFRL
jgi:hypothetical protein